MGLVLILRFGPALILLRTKCNKMGGAPAWRLALDGCLAVLQGGRERKDGVRAGVGRNETDQERDTQRLEREGEASPTGGNYDGIRELAIEMRVGLAIFARQPSPFPARFPTCLAG